MSIMKAFFSAIGTHVNRIVEFFSRDILDLDPEELSRTKAALVKCYRIMHSSIGQFGKNKIGIMSVALSYFTMMAVVPFIAVCFALTGGLGLSGLLEDVLYANISDTKIIELLLNAAENIIHVAQGGGFGIINALTFVWLVIWMMMRVEKVFNDIWASKSVKIKDNGEKKQKRRNFFASFGVDIAILFLAPFVIIILFTGSIVYSRVLDIVIPNNLGFSEELRSFVGWVVFAIVAILVFSAMYKFIPAAKVRYRDALYGAVLSGIAYTILQYLYLETQLLVSGFNTVFGTVAALPLFMIWLRYGWLIIMLGAQFSYTFQYPDEPINNEYQ